MAIAGIVTSRWHLLLLHLLLALIGFSVLLGVVFTVVVVISLIGYSLLTLLLGAPITGIVEVLSSPQLVTEQTADPFSWVAGFLLVIVLLPYFARYYRWVGDVLYDRDADRGSEH